MLFRLLSTVFLVSSVSFSGMGPMDESVSEYMSRFHQEHSGIQAPLLTSKSKKGIVLNEESCYNNGRSLKAIVRVHYKGVGREMKRTRAFKWARVASLHACVKCQLWKRLE